MKKAALPTPFCAGNSRRKTYLTSKVRTVKRLFQFALLTLLLPCVAWAQGFKVSGNQLLDANGNNFIMKGINVPTAWFTTDVNNNIANIRNRTNANTLRIVVTTSTSDAAWQTTVANCIANKIIPMVELHDVTGSNSASELQRMANFWASKASYFKRADIAKYILINIANEWGDWFMSSPTNAPDGTVWRDAYINAVKTLRNAGINTTIVVDAPGYGQDNKVNTLLAHAKSVQAGDPQHNVLFSIHMYCEWAVNGNSTVTTHLPSVKNAGIPVIVGEFGYQHSEGSSTCDINESQIISTCQSNGIGWLAWSWKGNGGSVSYLDLSYDWGGTSLSGWGNTVVNGSNGTKTAVTASVFSTTSGCGTAPNGYPYCCNGSASDPDGDGWGWENSRSCVVRGGPAGRLGVDSELSQLVVYPNPSAATFTVEQAGTFEYTLQNASGKKLEEGQATDKATLGKSLGAGVYILRVQSAQGTKVIKMVKN